MGKPNSVSDVSSAAWKPDWNQACSVHLFRSRISTLLHGARLKINGWRFLFPHKTPSEKVGLLKNVLILCYSSQFQGGEVISLHVRLWSWEFLKPDSFFGQVGKSIFFLVEVDGCRVVMLQGAVRHLRH